MTDLWVARLRLWDQLRWVVTVNSTLLSHGDNLGLKHFNFEFIILRSPRKECSRTTVCSPSSCSLPPLIDTQLSFLPAKKYIESTSPESEVSDMSCTEDLDSASSQWSPPKSNSSPAKEEMSREWMFNSKNRGRVDADSDSKSNTHAGEFGID